jgi:voltage-gated potassium channel Kch
VSVDTPEPAAPDASVGDAVRVLIVGWSSFGPKVMEELHEFLGRGSQIVVCVDPALVDPSTGDEIHRVAPGSRVRSVTGGPENLRVLSDEEPFDQVIVLGYRGGMSVSEADSRTLLTLLTLRVMWPDAPSRVRIIAQLLDQENVELAATTGVDDFIVSDELSSLMIAQLSERLELQEVFRELFDVQGCFVSLRPAVLYAVGATTFGDVVRTAAARGDTAFGYRLGRQNVVMNPPKSTVLDLGATDSVLVLGPRSARAAAPPALESIPTVTPTVPA